MNKTHQEIRDLLSRDLLHLSTQRFGFCSFPLGIGELFSAFGPHSLLSLLEGVVAGDRGALFSCQSLIMGLNGKIGRDRGATSE